MAAFGLNTYLYAPKDDLKHRTLWRERYSPEEADALAETIRDLRRARPAVHLCAQSGARHPVRQRP